MPEDRHAFSGRYGRVVDKRPFTPALWWTGTLAPLVCTKLFLHWSRMAFIVLHKELNTGNLLYDLAPVDDLEVVCA